MVGVAKGTCVGGCVVVGTGVGEGDIVASTNALEVGGSGGSGADTTACGAGVALQPANAILTTSAHKRDIRWYAQ